MAARAVDADVVAFLEFDARVCAPGGLPGVVDDELRAAGDAGLADLAGDDGGMAGHATARGQNGTSGNDSVKVLRRGLVADELFERGDRGAAPCEHGGHEAGARLFATHSYPELSMAKIARENAVRERRMRKEARKNARKQAAADDRAPSTEARTGDDQSI